MSSLRLLFRVGLALGLLLVAARPAEGVTVQLTLAEFTGDDAEVRITLDDSTGNIVGQVDVIPSPNIGDLRAVFFSLNDSHLVCNLSATGSLVTAVAMEANCVTSVGNANVNGGGSPGPFDVGIAFGSSGIGSDDIQSASFILEYECGPLTLDMLDLNSFAARLTSVGLLGGSRNGSSKLSVIEALLLNSGGGGGGGGGDDDDDGGTGGGGTTTSGGGPAPTAESAIPEPASLVFVAMGVAGFAIARRRRALQQR